MALIVQKFGGTSVNGEVRIKVCVALVQKELSLGNKVVVVVSAMAGFTDSLLSQAINMGASAKREIDVVLSAGEQISSGMMAIALNNTGIKAKSWLGWQLPITTDGNFTDAAIQQVNTQQLMADLNEGITPVIAGFQGVTNNQITTLGRGGADTTAAAIAAALNADRCDIYTDVDGVYTADPRQIPNVKKLDTISYEEMLEMSMWGAKVVHSRSVDIAMRSKVPMQVLSSFNEIPGTLITSTPYKTVAGITTSPQSFAVLHLVDSTDISICNNLHIHAVNTDNGLDILIPSSSQKEIIDRLQAMGVKYAVKDNLRSVSIVGNKVTHKGTINAKVLDCITNHDIIVFMTICTDLRATIVVEATKATNSIIALHKDFCFNNRPE